MRKIVATGVSVVFGVLGLVACGSEGSSTFTGNGSGGAGSGAVGDPGSGSFSEIGPSGTTSACVTSKSNAALQGANLVMMFDKSGSMGDTSNQPPFDPTLKWIPVTAAMKSFFADPASATLSASLQFFPIGDTIDAICNYGYATPAVAMQPLADATPFQTTLDATKPQGGTPTLPALMGAVTYAKTVAAAKPGEKTVIVLITDGDPGVMVPSSGCPGGATACFAPGCADTHECAADASNPYDASCNNTVSRITQVAAGALADGVPTYVIGVGSSFEKTNLSAFARAGGTNDAIFIDTGNPSATSAALQSALDQIRSTTLSCFFDIPPAPAGQTIDTNAVNVAYTPTGGGEEILTYSKDCSQPNAWRYDNPTAPSKIELCGSMCSSAQKDPGGKITLAFGCATKGDLK